MTERVIIKIAVQTLTRQEMRVIPDSHRHLLFNSKLLNLENPFNFLARSMANRVDSAASCASFILLALYFFVPVRGAVSS